MFDLLLEAVLRGGVAEESDVGGFFWNDGDLIDFFDHLFIDIVLEEQMKGVEDKSSWYNEVGM